MSAAHGHPLVEGQPYTQEQITEELVTVLSSFVDEELLRQCRDQTSGATLLECVRRAVEKQEQQHKKSGVVPTMVGQATLPDGYVSGDLRKASTDGDAKEVRRLLEAKVNPNASDEAFAGWGPLHYAAQQGHSETVSYTHLTLPTIPLV